MPRQTLSEYRSKTPVAEALDLPYAGWQLDTEQPLAPQLAPAHARGDRLVLKVDRGKVTKPVIAYVAGTVAELFDTPPQFGHAKAMAASPDERAEAKKEALRAEGVLTLDTFADLGPTLATLPGDRPDQSPERPIAARQRRLIASRVSGDLHGDVQLLGQDLLDAVEDHDHAGLVISLLLGHPVKPGRLVDFADYVLCLSVDHGPYVSGALNTIVAARAGKDLVSSLAAGLLTIGPRFGGAINTAASYWLRGVQDGQTPKELVDGLPPSDSIIAGIGHAKYRVDIPDPRVATLRKRFAGNSNGDRYLDYALGVEDVTTPEEGQPESPCTPLGRATSASDAGEHVVVLVADRHTPPDVPLLAQGRAERIGG